MPLNLYTSLDSYKRFLKVAIADNDPFFLDQLEQASRVVDDYCKREFFTVDAVRKFPTGNSAVEVLIDDVLVVSELVTDVDHDGAFGETWTEATDFELWPDNDWPKTAVQTTDFGNFTFAPNIRRYAKITGTWGFGDGESSSPWLATTINLSVATAGGLVFTAAPTPVGTIEVGHTLLVESEQVGIVTAVAAGTVSVERRGINGTTAVAHAAPSAGSIAQYPSAISMATREMATADENTRDTKGFQISNTDGHGFTNIMRPDTLILRRFLDPYRRLEV